MVVDVLVKLYIVVFWAGHQHCIKLDSKSVVRVYAISISHQYRQRVARVSFS